MTQLPLLPVSRKEAPVTLAVYRYVRTLESPALEALASLAAVVRAQGIDARLALDLAAFERQVRGEGAGPARPVPPAGDQGPTGPRGTLMVTAPKPATPSAPAAVPSKVAPRPAPAPAPSRSPTAPGTALATGAPAPKAPKRPPLIKACLDCGKERIAACRSKYEAMGPRCQACNGRHHLAKAWKAAAAKREASAGNQADTEPEPAPAPIATEVEQPAPIATAAEPEACPEAGARKAEPTPPPSGQAASKASRPVPAKVHPWKDVPQPTRKGAGPAERAPRRFTCQRLECGKTFIAEAERARTVPYCPECQAELSPRIVLEETIVGDGTGGLERGRVYRRKVLAPAGWREEAAE